MENPQSTISSAYAYPGTQRCPRGNWRCFRCRERLTSDSVGLRCHNCGKIYPVVGDIPILVSEPVHYLRSELAFLNLAHQDARQRRALIERLGAEIDLSAAALSRHRDVIDAEIARAEAFQSLLEPAGRAVKALDESGNTKREALGLRRPGWAFETLLPYLVRDWSYTDESESSGAVISAALKELILDPAGTSVVFAGCGAAGLLSKLPSGFDSIFGFDLALPILSASRRLMDGNAVDLALPRCTNPRGSIRLQRRAPVAAAPPIVLVAMDACNTAFCDGVVDCVITSFLLDLIADPRDLAREIHRILSSGGIWINYGPSGTPDALWRFDHAESAVFLESAGFSICRAEAHRATYLDLTRDDPSSSFQDHLCYLTVARKTAVPTQRPQRHLPDTAELASMIPCHFPGANLVQQQSLLGDQGRSVLLRHERIQGRIESLEIGVDTARILTLVDSKRTVREIAELLERRMPALPADETVRAFGRYFEQGLLTWHARRG